MVRATSETKQTRERRDGRVKEMRIECIEEARKNARRGQERKRKSEAREMQEGRVEGRGADGR